MLRSAPLETGEIYHIFNRGAHKQKIFSNDKDYRRFQINMYLANHSEPIVFRDILRSKKYIELFSVYSVDYSLVDVLGYSLMPNHFHMIVRQKVDGGITRYLKKVAGGYSMYFNTKYEHSGTLFQGPFKSSHVSSDPYFQWIFAYVHLNPVSIIEPKWEEKEIGNNAKTQKFLNDYKYSSYADFYGKERPERAILAYNDAREYVDTRASMKDLIRNFQKRTTLFSNT